MCGKKVGVKYGGRRRGLWISLYMIISQWLERSEIWLDITSELFRADYGGQLYVSSSLLLLGFELTFQFNSH
jgi:hypothetical protein